MTEQNKPGQPDQNPEQRQEPREKKHDRPGEENPGRGNERKRNGEGKGTENI